MEDSLLGGLLGPVTRSWLGVIWGPLSPAGRSSSPSVLPSANDISTLMGPKAHIPAA